MANDPKAEILSMASEDYYGLYEVIWLLNNLQPHLAEGTRVEMAKTSVRELLASGQINIYESIGLSNDYKRLSKEVAERVIMNEVSWDLPSKESTNYFISAG